MLYWDVILYVVKDCVSVIEIISTQLEHPSFFQFLFQTCLCLNNLSFSDRKSFVNLIDKLNGIKKVTFGRQIVQDVEDLKFSFTSNYLLLTFIFHQYGREIIFPVRSLL